MYIRGVDTGFAIMNLYIITDKFYFYEEIIKFKPEE